VATAMQTPVSAPETQSRGQHAGTRIGPVTERTLVQLFLRQAASRGGNPAMFHRDGDHWAPIGWDDYATQARSLAAFFMSTGLLPSEHVAIWSFNRPEFVISSTATLLAGACTAPLYQTLSAEEAAYVFAHSDSPIAVVENQALLARVLAVRDRLPSLRCVVLMDGDVPAGEEAFVVTWADAMRRGTDAVATLGDELDARGDAVGPADVATLVYTSGTTGPPKAVMATHQNLIAAINALAPIVDLSTDDRVLSYLPLAHILERLNSEIRLYCAGNPLWFAASIAEMPAEVRDLRPTCFVGVPRVWEKMAATIDSTIDALPAPRRRIARWAISVGGQVVDCAQRGSTPSRVLVMRHRLADRLVLRHVREETGLDQAHTLITGAAPISPHVLRFFHALGLEILEGYGMSENMTVTSVNRRGHAHLGTVGQVIPGVDLRIADDGEICMRGEVLFAGYYKDPVATAEAVVDGWLHTGDIGELDTGGFLRITDRKKDLIITAGGKNVSPSNIEDELRSELIANPVVIGDRRPYLVALLTLDTSGLAALAGRLGLLEKADDLISHPKVLDEVRRRVDAVNTNLANVEKIRRWLLLPREFVVGVELTPTFKVRRKVVAERFAGEIESLYTTRPEAARPHVDGA
jgi:long-chain acyl-CoA synthetase